MSCNITVTNDIKVLSMSIEIHVGKIPEMSFDLQHLEMKYGICTSRVCTTTGNSFSKWTKT